MPAPKLDAQQLEKLELVVCHLQMLECGLGKKHDEMLERLGIASRVEHLYNTFALMHLISTLFLVDGQGEPMGGACYRLLNAIGLARVLGPIQKTLRSKVGKTNFGDFVRLQRNRLATHGSLELATLPSDVREAMTSKRALAQFERLMTKFDDQVTNLRDMLETRLQRERARLLKGQFETTD